MNICTFLQPCKKTLSHVRLHCIKYVCLCGFIMFLAMGCAEHSRSNAGNNATPDETKEEALFRQLDADEDGTISTSEWLYKDESFSKLDQDEDNFLSLEELSTVVVGTADDLLSEDLTIPFQEIASDAISSTPTTAAGIKRIFSVSGEKLSMSIEVNGETTIVATYERAELPSVCQAVVVETPEEQNPSPELVGVWKDETTVALIIAEPKEPIDNEVIVPELDSNAQSAAGTSNLNIDNVTTVTDGIEDSSAQSTTGLPIQSTYTEIDLYLQINADGIMIHYDVTEEDCNGFPGGELNGNTLI